jgi:hypothetical protein
MKKECERAQVSSNTNSDIAEGGGDILSKEDDSKNGGPLHLLSLRAVVYRVQRSSECRGVAQKSRDPTDPLVQI